MRLLIWIALLISFASSATVQHGTWGKGMTFSGYLDRYGIAQQLLAKISEEDKKFLSEIPYGVAYYELTDSAGALLQSLIPLNEALQIHLYREAASGEYGFDIIPVEFRQEERYVEVEIQSNPYSDTLGTVKENPEVAKRIAQVLKGNVNPKKLRKGDKLKFLYFQKRRLDSYYTAPDIKVATLHSGGKERFIFADEDGIGHAERAENARFTLGGDYERRIKLRSKSKQFGMPLRRPRITSHFSYRRWHPILKRYRPHHGTDFGARRGTPLLAVYDGKVSFAGRMGGYGKVVKIKHPKGYESLYAHQSRIKVKRGQRVKKGDVIGYVGSTGRSTGPHLHFGLRKHGKWINPMKVLKVAYLDKKVKYKTIMIKDAKRYKERLLRMSQKQPVSLAESETGHIKGSES